MIKHLPVLLMCLGLAACEINEGAAVDAAKDMVAKSLKDPSSAEFGDVTFVASNKAGERHYGRLCGTVNSKNSFGGYTGMKRFSSDMYYTKSGTISVSDVQLEEGKLAELSDEGITYFEKYYWRKVCIPGSKG